MVESFERVVGFGWAVLTIFSAIVRTFGGTKVDEIFAGGTVDARHGSSLVGKGARRAHGACRICARLPHLARREPPLSTHDARSVAFLGLVKSGSTIRARPGGFAELSSRTWPSTLSMRDRRRAVVTGRGLAILARVICRVAGCTVGDRIELAEGARCR